ncbi:MAG: ABC transporter ATP-binding protein [Christensenella sp.]|uniref:ABC transporter ATP-binding protein n=1 Tax=Christensenella sp. TaxID=1935934 RepID=UPI002B1F6129|nr:ABC transporter ATP-binding protein [Christensenella sp.]MEA5003527.1 ABC transporter ATP-binding protein [Christensenella sp.]
MLKVENLIFNYGNVEILHGLSFKAEKGKITVLIGTNGAGKTTTMKAIMGMMPIKSGSIEWDGTALNKMKSHAVTQSGVSLCPEGRQLFPDMTVYENLIMGAYTRTDKKEIENSVEEVFGWFPRLKDRTSQLAGTLSGGEQEMLAIARALMAKPQLLMLDEPSWGLAPILVEEVGNIVRDINKRGTTVLLVEQNTQMAFDLADYVYVLETGNIVIEGTAEELSKDKTIHETYLGI